MTVVVFTNGPLKGRGREYPHLPKQVFQPVGAKGSEDFTFLYEYEVDQYPFADGEAREGTGTEPVYEARQAMMWIAPKYGPFDDRFARPFGPGRPELKRVLEPDTRKRLEAFEVELKELMDTHGVGWDHHGGWGECEGAGFTLDGFIVEPDYAVKEWY